MTMTIPPFGTSYIKVVFSPDSPGPKTGTISFTSNSVNSPHTIQLSGVGKAAAVVVDPPTPVSPLTYLTASGSKLVDAASNEVMLRSINWYGFEQIGVPGGAWTRPFRTKTVEGTVKEGMLDEIKRLGFNSIRLLFSIDCTWAGYRPFTDSGQWNSTYINPDLNGEFLNDLVAQGPQNVKTSIEIMDLIVGWCEELNIRIIFDLHCLAPDDSNILGTNGKWYTTATPTAAGGTNMGVRREPRSETQTIAALVFLADRYKNRPVVCGFDMINEPHACTWDRDSLTGVLGFYERAGNAIHAVNPNVLIVCEGVAELGADGGTVDHTPVGYENTTESQQGYYNWGVIWSGGLGDVGRTANLPVQLTLPNKVVYSPHEYGSWPGNPGHQWFNPEVINGYPGPAYPDNLFEVWRRQWGYLAEENIAPVWIGEFGSYLRIGGDPLGGGASYSEQNLAWDTAWLNKLAEYCNTHKVGFAFWALNPGGDPDGLLQQQPAGTWLGAQTFKLSSLAPFLPLSNDPSNNITVSANSISYGNETIGTPKPLTVTVTNTTTSPITVTLATGAPFTTNASVVIGALSSTVLTVNFTASAAIAYNGTLTLSWTGSSKQITLTGTGTSAPVIVGPNITTPPNAIGVTAVGDSITKGGFYENNGWLSKLCFYYN